METGTEGFLREHRKFQNKTLKGKKGQGFNYTHEGFHDFKSMLRLCMQMKQFSTSSTLRNQTEEK